MSEPALRAVKIDRGIPSRLAEVPQIARELEAHGYDGCWTGEINHDPFLPLALAAEHTERIQIGTSIAVAFARNPMTMSAGLGSADVLGWTLHPRAGHADPAAHRKAIQHAVEPPGSPHARVHRSAAGDLGMLA